LTLEHSSSTSICWNLSLLTKLNPQTISEVRKYFYMQRDYIRLSNQTI